LIADQQVQTARQMLQPSALGEVGCQLRRNAVLSQRGCFHGLATRQGLKQALY
jgi:hypothetical protein